MEYYDLNLLSKGDIYIDKLIQRVSLNNSILLQHFRQPNRIWKEFFDITPKLVRAYSSKAYEHILHIKEDHKETNPKFDFLYFLSDENEKMYNSVYFNYENFPLMVEKDEVLNEIRKIAQKFSVPNTNEFDATCLYLIYFYACIINKDSNWITMDYITNGNKYHQYGTRLKREIETVTKRIWK